GEAKTGPADPRWQVAAGDECSAGGTLLLRYPGYFVDRSRPAREAPPLSYGQEYWNVISQRVQIQQANSNILRHRITPWYAGTLDENDAYLGSTHPPEQLQLSPDNKARPLLGMHGEPISWVNSNTQLYHLGDGTRSYDPGIQRFLTADPYSPFSVGGINPYAFCVGDPVNRLDTTGYLSFRAGSYSYSFSASAAIYGGSVGLIGGTLSLLAALAATGLFFILATVIGSILIIIGSALQVASGAMTDDNPDLATALGNAANILIGVGSLFLLPSVAKDAYSGILKIKQKFFHSAAAAARHSATGSSTSLSISSHSTRVRSFTVSSPDLSDLPSISCPKTLVNLPRSQLLSPSNASELSLYHTAKTSPADSVSMVIQSFLKLS
ncbi:MAG: RHS repeat-associated core domain-containing protein, partial [Microvirgula sp.]